MPNITINWAISPSGSTPQIITAVPVTFDGQTRFFGFGDTKTIIATSVTLTATASFVGAGGIVAEDASSVAADLYARLAPIADPYDRERGFPLFAYAAGIASMFEPMDDLVDQPEILVDPDRTPDNWLPWLGQFIDAGIPAGGSGNPAADRAAIKDPPRHRRGTVAAILEEFAARLKVGATIFYSERDVGGSAYHGRITIQTKDLLVDQSQASLQALVNRIKPSIVIIDVSVTNGIDYNALLTTHNTYNIVKTVFKTYTEVKTTPTKQ